MRGLVITTLCGFMCAGLSLPASFQAGGRSGRSSSGFSSSRPVSPVAVVTWFGRHAGDAAVLELLVVWRGSPGWFLAGQSGGSGGGGMGGDVNATLRYGAVHLSVSYSPAKDVVTIQDTESRLGGNNVVLVDHVDTPDGPKVVATHRVDPAVPDSKQVEVAMRRSHEVIAFLRCGTAMPDARMQPMIDKICEQIIGKPPGP